MPPFDRFLLNGHQSSFFLSKVCSFCLTSTIVTADCKPICKQTNSGDTRPACWLALWWKWEQTLYLTCLSIWYLFFVHWAQLSLYLFTFVRCGVCLCPTVSPWISTASPSMISTRDSSFGTSQPIFSLCFIYKSIRTHIYTRAELHHRTRSNRWYLKSRRTHASIHMSFSVISDSFLFFCQHCHPIFNAINGQMLMRLSVSRQLVRQSKSFLLPLYTHIDMYVAK